MLKDSSMNPRTYSSFPKTEIMIIKSHVSHVTSKAAGVKFLDVHGQEIYADGPYVKAWQAAAKTLPPLDNYFSNIIFFLQNVVATGR